MSKKELLIYEMPWYAAFVSWDWLQGVIARRVARKVNRKVARFNKIVEMRKKYEPKNTNRGKRSERKELWECLDCHVRKI